MNLRVRLAPCSRTDVVCLGCFRFRCDHVIVLADGSESEIGIHKKCLPRAAARFTRQRRTEAAAE